MKDYINYVISVINPDGEEVNLPASKKDDKHIMSFLRLMYESGFDNTALMRYINDNGYKITGFELSKFLASEGNIILCHTDVHNCFSGTKEASLMRPESITVMQYDSLVRMTSHLSDFHIYYGVVHYKNEQSQKIIYQRTNYENFMNHISLSQERGDKYAKR